MTIRDVTVADLEAIAAIQAAAPETTAWPPASYLDYDCRVAIVEHRVAGFIVSHAVATDEREILNVAVAPDHRRHGIGRALVTDELERSAERRFLEVRESNQAAINLYTSMGFVATGRRKDYYRGVDGNPDETAIVMTFFS